MLNSLTYSVPEIYKNKENLRTFLIKHPEIKFISIVGVDFLGNDTDERIPIEYFLTNMDNIFRGGVQTDGSSVHLPNISALNDAKVDFIIDFDTNWYIDYNFDYIFSNNLPVGTIRIPAFLKHNGRFYCSRSVLANTVKFVEREILKIIKNDNDFLNQIKIDKDDISDITFTLGTELEFWVRTPASKVTVDELAVSQMLKESYWKRTRGEVRSGLEESLILLQKYGFSPEMGHKEVGGIKGKITRSGTIADTMEQLEIDWHYNTPRQAADNELYARILIKEVFRKRGLEVTFNAKPLCGIAGSGEHMHIGATLKLKNGAMVNLFDSYDILNYMSKYGYGALMGILKNWDYINPFISHSNSALKRLKPGYEAPVSIVASLGHSPEEPSRNRTVLVGLVKGNSPKATRFEIRAANPHTNTYMATSAILIGMLDGIKYAQNKDRNALHKEITKKYGKESDYLEKNREYVTNKNIFKDYSKHEREKLFGKSPVTVWDVIKTIRKSDIPIYKDSPLSNKIIDSFYTSALNKWLIEIREKEMPMIRKEIGTFIRYENSENSFDEANWHKVDALIKEISKSSENRESMISSLEKLLNTQKFDSISKIYSHIEDKMNELRKAYKNYLKNVINNT